MEKIKVLIADDDGRIRKAIEKILLQNFSSVEVVAQTNSVEDTIYALYENRPHIAVLDIHLLGGTAIEVIRRTSDLDFKVIFMSAYQEYVLDDIRLASIDFIYKPLDISDLLVVFDQVISDMVDEGYGKKLHTFFLNTDSARHGKNVVFKTHSGILSVAISDIVCGESVYGGAKFYFNSQKTIEIGQSLRQYESILQSFMFYRCHPHYVINLKQIHSVDSMAQNVFMKNGQLIPVEGRKLEILQSKFVKKEKVEPVCVSVFNI